MTLGGLLICLLLPGTRAHERVRVQPTTDRPCLPIMLLRRGHVELSPGFWSTLQETYALLHTVRFQAGR